MVRAPMFTGLWMVVLLSAAVGARPLSARSLPRRGSPQARVPLVGSLGRSLRALARRPPDTRADTRAGWTALASALAFLVDPRLAVLVAIGSLLHAVSRTRRASLALERAVISEMPEIIDLLRLALMSGGSLQHSVEAAAGDGEGPVASALRQACVATQRGHRFADALRSGDASASALRPLMRALADAEQYGSRLQPVLDRLSTEARATRRRRAQTAARQVPVKLLLPLVVCVLPAFVLLSVVPTLVETFQNLDLGGP